MQFLNHLSSVLQVSALVRSKIIRHLFHAPADSVAVPAIIFVIDLCGDVVTDGAGYVVEVVFRRAHPVLDVLNQSRQSRATYRKHQ